MSSINKKRSQIVAKDLGKSAARALAEGGKWSYSPDDVDCGDAWAYNCGESDCDRKWHKHWIMTGYRIANKKLFHVMHKCDEDGNWDVIDECNVDDPVYDHWYKSNFSEEERQQGWNDYAVHVAHTGEDILDNYIVDRWHKEAWTAKLIQDEKGVKFDGAHKRSLAYIERVAERDFTKIIKPVRDFLCLNKDGLIEGFASLDELMGENYHLQRGEGFAIIDFEVEVPDSKDEIKQRLKDAALNSIESE